jgi:diacylglycerol O-acyltransferase
MRMSNAEAIMWAVEKDPALRSDFCNLTILDRRPSDTRMRATAERALEAIPRLGQRVVSAPLRIVPPEFADDPTLDINAHMRVVAVPSPGGERELLDLCGQLAEQPLDRARPLWEFTLIEGLEDGRAALLQKLHHTISDGVGALKLSLALVDFERHPDSKPPDVVTTLEPEPTTHPLGVARNAVVEATQRGIEAIKRTAVTAGHVVAHPSEVPSRAGDVARLAGSVHRQVLVTGNAHSDVMTNRSLRRDLHVYQANLSDLRVAAARLGGSVNDVFITAVASALGRYHDRRGSAVEDLRLAMPISTRERGDEANNRFVPARVLIPIQPADDVAALFTEVHGRLEDTKRETVLPAAEGLAGFVTPLPTSVLVAFTRSQTRTIDFAASNLRGSPVPLYLAGARIIASYPFGPRTACAINVTMLSYCDDVHMGLNIDPAAITDVDEFMRDVDDAFRALTSFA